MVVLVVPTTQARCTRHGCSRGRAGRAPFLFLLLTHHAKCRKPGGSPVKIAIVAQHATPLRPCADGSGPRPDDAGLTDLTRVLARQGHHITVYCEKRHADLPDRAELGDGDRVEQVTPNAATRRTDDGSGDADLLARVPAFSELLRARWRHDRPDVVHAVRWTSGLAALAAARDLGIPVVQSFSSLGVAERRDHAASAPPARMRLVVAIGRSANAVLAASSADGQRPDPARRAAHLGPVRAVGREHRRVRAGGAYRHPRRPVPAAHRRRPDRTGTAGDPAPRAGQGAGGRADDRRRPGPGPDSKEPTPPTAAWPR